MSESDKFTMDDAENDGLIKREAGKTAASQASQHAVELWDMFNKVCQNQGREPEEVLGDHVIRAIRSESHARRLSEVNIDLSQINSDQLSIEDAQFIQQMMDSLGLQEESSKDPLQDYMERRLESATQSPISRVRGRGKHDVDEDVRNELDEIKEQISRMAEEQSSTEAAEPEQEEKANLDELVSDATSDNSDTGGSDTPDSSVDDSSDGDGDSGDMNTTVEVRSTGETGSMSASPTEFATSEDLEQDE